VAQLVDKRVADKNGRDSMSSVRVRVRAADAGPADSGVEVELPAAPAGWVRDHTDAVANAVGVDTHGAFVSIRFADGEVEELPAGRAGWRMIAAMEPGDVLLVSSSAAAAPKSRAPARMDASGVPLPEEEQNNKRLSMLFLSGPAEVRKAMQQVCANSLL
jgi:hypothetical protein